MKALLLLLLAAAAPLVVCDETGSFDSSASSSSSMGDPTDSNIAAAVGACMGIIFLFCFFIFLERRYPNAAVGFK